MRLPQSLEGLSCEDLSSSWGIHPYLARRLLELDAIWRFDFPNLGGLRIISGARTLQEQRELEASGRPAADPARSTHLTCPATGADLALGVAADDAVKLELGTRAIWIGLRWGGGSSLDARGIPLDWNHVDLGPRDAS